MRPFTENHLGKNSSSWEKLQHLTMKGKKFQNSIRMNKIVNKLKEPSNGEVDVINNRGTDSAILAKGRHDQANALCRASSKAAELTKACQVSSLDPKLDPRFKNLLRSLTPIDC